MNENEKIEQACEKSQWKWKWDWWMREKKERKKRDDWQTMNEWTDKKVTSRQTDRWERMKEGWLRQAERNNKQDRLTNELKLTIEWEMKGKEERKGDWQEMMMMNEQTRKRRDDWKMIELKFGKIDW